MIGYLKGTLFQVSPGLVLLDVGGVGYEVRVPLSTFFELPEEGEEKTGNFRKLLESI